jgi:hypothetical protein
MVTKRRPTFNSTSFLAKVGQGLSFLAKVGEGLSIGKYHNGQVVFS